MRTEVEGPAAAGVGPVAQTVVEGSAATDVGRPTRTEVERPAADVLSQVAEAFRLRGSVSGVFTAASPWGVSFPESDHAGLLVVKRGRIYFEMASPRRALELAPGDVLALPHGHAYTLRDSPDSPVRPIQEFAPCKQAARMQAPGGDTAFLGLCCELAGGRANPVRDVLPPLIHLPATHGATAGWLEPTVRLLAMESVSHTPGRSIVLNRLAEIVFVQLIRVWIDSLPAGEGGWLRALKDGQLASAMQAMHAEPGEAWTLESLAERASMSRSSFAARFKAVVGETPLDYLTRWRIQRAMSLLEQGDVPLKEIVARSGYASEAAFRTVFKNRVGESPGSYRARVRGD